MTAGLAIRLMTAVLFVSVPQTPPPIPPPLGTARQPAAATNAARPLDALLEMPRLDASIRIASLKRQSTSVSAVMDALSTTTRVTVHYDGTLPELLRTCTVNLVNASLEEALNAVLKANGVGYTVLGPKEVLAYSETPANVEKFSWAVRTFHLTRADPSALTAVLYRELNKASGTRPIIVVAAEPATINVRATGEKMALIAKLVGDNDKH